MEEVATVEAPSSLHFYTRSWMLVVEFGLVVNLGFQLDAARTAVRIESAYPGAP